MLHLPFFDYQCSLDLSSSMFSQSEVLQPVLHVYLKRFAFSQFRRTRRRMCHPPIRHHCQNQMLSGPYPFPFHPFQQLFPPFSAMRAKQHRSSLRSSSHYYVMSVGRILRLLLAAAVMASAPAVQGTDSDGLGRVSVCPLHFNWQTIQPRPVSQPGGSPSPHCRFKTVPRCTRGHPANPNGGPLLRHHGRRGGRCWLSAGRPTSASR